MIKIENITKVSGTHRVLDNITLEIKEQETTAIIGPSGCGKSTLLRLIIGLEQPNSGTILIDNRAASFSRSKIGMVFQSSALFDSLTVGENVAFGLRVQNYSERDIKRIVEEKLEMVELAGTADLMPSELSGGMQKRVSLARAIAFDPKIVLYDEPTTGLDPITSTSIENLMNKLGKELKVTSVLVTHQLSTIFRCAQSIYLLDKGKLIPAGSPPRGRETQQPGSETIY